MTTFVSRGMKLALAAVVSALLAACFVSETPLLDDSNGRATPLKPGAYVSCPFSEGKPDGECTPLQVDIDASHLYRLQDPKGDLTLVRFRRIGHGAHLAQMASASDGDGYFYFVGARSDGKFVLTMMVCRDAPDALKAALVEKDALEISDNGETCTPKTVGAAVRAARAYRGRDAIAARLTVELTPAPERKGAPVEPL